MSFFKAIFINFFVVFFANYILPGIDVVKMTKLPHIEGDLIFAMGLGIANSLIYFVLKLMNQLSWFKMASLAIAINFIAYASLKLLPMGIHVISFQGYFSAAILVSIGSFLTNFFEMRHNKNILQSTPSQSEFSQLPPEV